MRKLWQTLEGIKSRMITTVSIGAKEEPYPMVSNVWDFFSSKGTKTVFVSVGTGNTCVPDLEFAETIGCPILKLDVPEDAHKWSEVKDILKIRKVSDTTTEFAKPASRKWVLPKNLITESVIPSLYKGTLETENGTVVTKPWIDIVESHCKAIGIPDDNIRLDILKVDSCPYQHTVLDSLWQTGLRPSLLLVHWISSPDSDLPTLLTAAHLQMIGYCLAAKEGNRYLYYFTDVNYYETTSWETVAKKYENPLMFTLIRSINPGSAGAIQFPLAE